MNPRIHELIHRHLQNELTDEEHQQLQAWIGASEANAALFDQLTDKEWLTEELLHMDGRYDRAAAWEKVKLNSQFTETKVISWRKWAAAAAVLLLMGGAAFWYTRPSATPVPTQAERFQNDVLPGKQGAVLTLADGREVSLDETPDGPVAQNASVNKGQLAYTNDSHPKELVFNKLSTPRGRSFRLQLSDGTTVWLNAASSIRYPMSFPDSVREVSISGEAYFEVAKSSTPFIVKVKDMDVLVLGTHFNVSAYEEDEKWSTTLAEGAVRVMAHDQIALLTPGKQAIFQRKEQTIQSTKADLEAVLGWKNDIFWFTNADIRSVMKQLERWYDIQVVFEDDVDVHFSGTIPRNVNISTILKTLELTNGVKFKVEGNKVIVLKN